MNIVIGLLFAGIGLFILTNGYGVRKLFLILSAIVTGLSGGCTLSILIGLTFLSKDRNYSSYIPIVLVICALLIALCWYVAVKYEMLWTRIFSVAGVLLTVFAVLGLAFLTGSMGTPIGPLVMIAVLLTIGALYLSFKFTRILLVMEICYIGAALASAGTYLVANTMMRTNADPMTSMIGGMILLLIVGVIYQTRKYSI